MAGRIAAERNSRGGIDLNISTPAASVAGLTLSPDQALVLASRILALLGRTSITNNPDGTWIAR